MTDKSIQMIMCTILCLSLTYLGFEYDSFWALLGAGIAFLGLVD